MVFRIASNVLARTSRLCQPRTGPTSIVARYCTGSMHSLVGQKHILKANHVLPGNAIQAEKILPKLENVCTEPIEANALRGGIPTLYGMASSSKAWGNGKRSKSISAAIRLARTVQCTPFQNFRFSIENPSRFNNNILPLAPSTKRTFSKSTTTEENKQPHPSMPEPKFVLGNKSLIKDGDEHATYPVIAIQVARSIDLSGVISNIFATRGVRKMRERLSVVAQLQPNSAKETATESARFVAVFGFGSVVFFNVSPKEMTSLLEEIKQFTTGSLAAEEQRKDRFCVHVQPPPASSNATGISIDENNDYDVDVVTADYCIVSELNMKAVDVISNIVAQSVALDAYNVTVDKLLLDFEGINNKVTSEGKLTPVDRDKLLRAVAQNNAIFLKLTKVGIKDRLDTAWNLSQYENISEGMREEFDIDRRFEHIEFKLNLVQQNTKFFLEVLANQKSDSLEWIIIVLILAECILMCIEMSGMGESLFAYLGELLRRPPVPS